MASAYGSCSRGHWRLVPRSTCSGPVYHLPVSGGSSEHLLRFQLGVCASGIVGDLEGRWVAPLLAGLPVSPGLSLVWDKPGK